MLALDNIIETGEQLILLFADISVSQDEEKTKWAVLRDKRLLIIPLIEQQKGNLESFTKIYETPLDLTGSKTSISLGDVVKLMIPDKTKKEIGAIRDRKNGTLRMIDEIIVLSWVIEPQSALDKLITPVNRALKTLANAFQINQEIAQLTLKFPTKVTFQQGAMEINENVEYDLTRLSDLRRLLEKSNAQLDEIKRLRGRLAEIIQTTFSLEELLKS